MLVDGPGKASTTLAATTSCWSVAGSCPASSPATHSLP